MGLRDASCQVGGKHRSLVDLEVDTGEVRRNRAILKCPGCVYPTECNVCIGSVERGCLQGGALVVADGDHGIAALVDQLLNVRRVRRVINSGRVGRLEPFSLECLQALVSRLVEVLVGRSARVQREACLVIGLPGIGRG